MKLNIKYSIAMIVVLTAGMIAAYVFYYIDRMLFYVSVGAVVMGVGLILAASRKGQYSEEKLMPRILMAAGIITAVSPPVNRFVLSGRLTEEQHRIAAACFAGACFILLGAAVMAVPLYTAHAKKRRCTDETMAKCAALNERFCGRSGTAYAPVWEYIVGTQMILAEEKRYSFRPPKIGDLHRISVNPDDPYDIYRHDPMRIAGGIAVGVLSMMIGALMLGTLFLTGI